MINNCEECIHYNQAQASKIFGHPCKIYGIVDPYRCDMKVEVHNLSEKYTAKYLHITMYDNDFINSLSLLADMLYAIFILERRFPEEDELPLLKKYIQPLWFSIHNINSIMSWNKNVVGFTETMEKYFYPTLEFIDYLDIPDWDDSQSAYIPMFENGEIIIR